MYREIHLRDFILKHLSFHQMRHWLLIDSFWSFWIYFSSFWSNHIPLHPINSVQAFDMSPTVWNNQLTAGLCLKHKMTVSGFSLLFNGVVTSMLWPCLRHLPAREAAPETLLLINSLLSAPYAGNWGSHNTWIYCPLDSFLVIWLFVCSRLSKLQGHI